MPLSVNKIAGPQTLRVAATSRLMSVTVPLENVSQILSYTSCICSSVESCSVVISLSPQVHFGIGVSWD